MRILPVRYEKCVVYYDTRQKKEKNDVIATNIFDIATI
jgi:hypothetical protein